MLSCEGCLSMKLFIPNRQAHNTTKAGQRRTKGSKSDEADLTNGFICIYCAVGFSDVKHSIIFACRNPLTAHLQKFSELSADSS